MSFSSTATTTTTSSSTPSSQTIPHFSLLTSLRYDPLLLIRSWNTWPGNPPSPFFLLPYHLERLVDGAWDFGWVVALESLGVSAEGEGEGCVRSWKGEQATDVLDEAKFELPNSEYKYAPALERFRTLCKDCVDRYFAEHPRSDVDQPLKIRITLSPAGALQADASPTLPRPYDLLAASLVDPSSLNTPKINSTSHLSTSGISTLSLPPFASPPIRVLLDSQPTPPSPFTSHKTTARAHYDAARARGSIPPCFSSAFSVSSSSPTPPPTEILLHTPDPASSALISEGSLRNVAFHRDNRWTTPPLSTGCLPGTVRRCLVESGRVVEGAVPQEEVQVGEWVMLCNGVEGCVLGVVGGVVGEASAG